MILADVLDPLTQRHADALAASSVNATAPGTIAAAQGDADVRQAPADIMDARMQAVQAGLLRLFLRATLFRQRVGAGLMVVFAVFCWRAVDHFMLMVWLAAGLSILALRNRQENLHGRSGALDDPQARADFVKRMQPIYALHGAVWGLSLFFCFEGLPTYDQLGCWLVLACVASAPLTTVALVPRLMRAYTNTMFVILICIMLVLTGTKNQISDTPNYLLLGLPFFYWWLLGRFGTGIHQNQSEQFGLQYDIAQKEQEARAAVETKDRFLAAASHDMRQPVMALSLYAEHLIDYPEMHLELAPKIAAASQAVKNLFESLFDLANLDSGKVRLHVEPVDIGDVLQGLCVQFGPLAEAKDIELRVHRANVSIRTDSVRLQRMIGNVLGNAIKYSPAGRKILLAARAHGDDIRVEVWDQGFGIPAKDIDKVFQEFYRVDRSDMPAIDGVGLGLSIVSRLSRVLNARVGITSVVGKGTRFTFCLSDVDSNDAQQTASLDVG